MRTVINNIINSLLQNNNIFGDNGVYFSNFISFEQSGISDKLINQFYIRPYRFDAVTTSSNGEDLPFVTSNFRCIFQLSDKIDLETATLSLAGQINEHDNVKVKGWGNDKKAIYLSEYNKDRIPMNLNLIAVDFSISKEVSFNCECLNLEV